MSGLFGYASLWQQEELSDVDIQLTVGVQAARPAFPAHSVLLSCSPLLKAQVGDSQPLLARSHCHRNHRTCRR